MIRVTSLSTSLMWSGNKPTGLSLFILWSIILNRIESWFLNKLIPLSSAWKSLNVRRLRAHLPCGAYSRPTCCDVLKICAKIANILMSMSIKFATFLLNFLAFCSCIRTVRLRSRARMAVGTGFVSSLIMAAF